MQFTLIALVSFFAVALAAPVATPERIDDLVARDPQVDTQAAAMTNANGDIVAFNSADVYLAATVAGQ